MAGRPEQRQREASAWRHIPRPVWALGFTSLFMDASSEAIHSILPIFIVQVLGASPEILGVLEGAAEGTTAFTKLFSGVLSDRLKARKSLTIAGYSLAGLSKPIFALAPSVAWVAAARITDRVGKGIRGAPRDALVADLTPPTVQGAAFGLRQALDTVGAIIGPLMALALMAWLGFGPRTVFWLAAIPAALSVATLALGVREPAQSSSAHKRWTVKGLSQLPAAFWAVCGIGGLTTMARFSEAFLVLRAQDQGLAVALVPFVLITMNIVYAAVAYPAGAISDRTPPYRLLVAGCITLAIADGLLAGTHPGLTRTMMGIAVWGCHMGLTQGVLSALVGIAAPQTLRASAFGIFNVVLGVAAIASSTLAGFLWQQVGPSMTFIAGAGFSAAAAGATLALAPFIKRGH
jgi:MFS family permease